MQVLSDEKWEQIFFFSSGFTWTSVKKEQSPLLWKKPWLFDEMAAVNDRMKSVWPLCVKNLTDSYRRFLKVPEKELLSISHVCRCYTSCSHSLAPCGCYWLFLTTVLWRLLPSKHRFSPFSTEQTYWFVQLHNLNGQGMAWRNPCLLYAAAQRSPIRAIKRNCLASLHFTSLLPIQILLPFCRDSSA